METLKLTFLMGGLALLAGCPGYTKDTDTAATTDESDSDTDGDSDTDADSDTDTDTDADSPLLTVAWVLEGGPNGGSFGNEFYPYDYNSNTWDNGNVLCHADTEMAVTDSYMECAACEFAYSYVGTTNGNLSGDYCEQFQATAGFADGVGYGFGATSDYAGSGLTGIYLYLADYPDYEWFTFTIDYGPVYYASINGESLSGSRVRVDQNTGYPVYYSYTP